MLREGWQGRCVRPLPALGPPAWDASTTAAAFFVSATHWQGRLSSLCFAHCWTPCCLPVKKHGPSVPCNPHNAEHLCQPIPPPPQLSDARRRLQRSQEAEASTLAQLAAAQAQLSSDRALLCEAQQALSADRLALSHASEELAAELVLLVSCCTRVLRIASFRTVGGSACRGADIRSRRVELAAEMIMLVCWS